MSSEGLEVVLSPLQLAAILENESIDRGSCLRNRLWGTASVLGGAVELIGAAALLLTPEPTTMTKVAGGVLAVHGSDTVSSGLTQIFSCQPQSTLTSQGAAAVARALGQLRRPRRTSELPSTLQYRWRQVLLEQLAPLRLVAVLSVWPPKKRRAGTPSPVMSRVRKRN
jgi:hypothetical protein